MVCIPHRFEDGVAGGGEAVPGGQVPFIGIDRLEESRHLCLGTNVRPDGRGVPQEVAAFIHRYGPQTVSGDPQADDAPLVHTAGGKQRARAGHHCVPPVCRALLMPPQLRVLRGIGNEGAGQAAALIIIQRSLIAARA